MIFHITGREAWERAENEGIYRDKSLEVDGFIHCSGREQVAKVANYLFKGQKNLLILSIDEEKVESRVIFEDLYQLEEEYPHIYGPLNLDAVIDVSDFIPNEEGFFSWS